MLALEHIRVLDTCLMGPGHICSQYLGDMGAEVIRVIAPPGSGKASNPFAAINEDTKKLAYDSTMRNKKCIAINLKDPGGKEAFLKLAKSADVILESARPGAAKRLGTDYESISKINPRIVYVSISGYGQDGPYALRPGHDNNYCGYAGILHFLGEKDGPPVQPSMFCGDVAGGSLHGVIGVLSALLAREKTGKGQFVDIALTDGALALAGNFMGRYFETGLKYERGGMPTCGSYPSYSCYKAKDGKWFTLGCFEPWFWQSACKLLGIEHLQEVGMMPFDAFDHPGPLPGNKFAEVRKELQEKFMTKNRDEWVDLLLANDIPSGPVYEMDEIVNDPQLKHRMVIEVEVPEVGKIKHPGFPIKMSDTPCKFTRRAPKMGEHTDELLQSIGYTKEQIADLKKSNAVA